MARGGGATTTATVGDGGAAAGTATGGGGGGGGGIAVAKVGAPEGPEGPKVVRGLGGAVICQLRAGKKVHPPRKRQSTYERKASRGTKEARHTDESRTYMWAQSPYKRGPWPWWTRTAKN